MSVFIMQPPIRIPWAAAALNSPVPNSLRVELRLDGAFGPVCNALCNVVSEPLGVAGVTPSSSERNGELPPICLATI